jgi:hypothetical protein
MDGHHFAVDMFVISAVVYLILRLFGRPIRFMPIMMTVVILWILIVAPLAQYFGITGLPFPPMVLGLPIVWWWAIFGVVIVGGSSLYNWLKSRFRRAEPPADVP